MKYHLTEDWLEYKKGHIMKDDDEIDYPKMVRSLLLKTGILEEVKEEEWPRNGDEYWFLYYSGEVGKGVWSGDVADKNCKNFGACFRSETEALEASEKIKTLLLSLKK